ncbi:MAG: hypothetical protein IJ790_00810 [Lachnospiraceae bacterium]|nr:hypothetical protein [Lachnospiraceae bacterium]
MYNRNDSHKKIAKSNKKRKTYESKKNFVAKTLNKVYTTNSGIRKRTK